MPRRIAVSQSNYIPWRGFFDLIDRADVFVVLDDVQYTHGDWRNRNRIKTPRGMQWLTIPVRRDFGQRIDQARVADPGWAERHWARIEQSYRRAPAFDETAPGLRAAYEAAADHERLTDVNRVLLEHLCRELGVLTPWRDAREFPPAEDPSARLVAICRALQADVYLSGPAAQAYLDQELFTRAGIEIQWMTYAGYPDYPQLHGPFEPRVSAVDLLLNTGADAAALIRA